MHSHDYVFGDDRTNLVLFFENNFTYLAVVLGPSNIFANHQFFKGCLYVYTVKGMTKATQGELK